MSMEEAIWGAEVGAPRVESVRDRIAITQPVPDNFYARCSAHQITHCMVCSMKERAAAQPGPIPPTSQTVVAEPMPFLSGMTAGPPPVAEPVPKIVALAETYAAAVRKLETEEKLLVVAQTRVEMLNASIAESKAAVEKARKNLATLVASDDGIEI